MMSPLDDTSRYPALASEIARQIGADGVTIEIAQKLAGGAIQENWRLDVTVSGGALDGRQAWALRTDARARLALSLDRAAEAKVLRAAHAAGVLVAEPIAIGDPSSGLGQPYVVQRFVDGSAHSWRVVRDPALSEVGPPLARDLARELSLIHAMTPQSATLSCLPIPVLPPARAVVARLREVLTHAGEPRPALEYVLGWLDTNPPPPRGLTLVHGDFRTGNYMVQDGRLVAVLDWEFAHWGDPDEDIGWLSARCWRFGNDELEAGGIARLDEFMSAYEAASGRKVAADAVRYWQIMAAARWATIAVLQGDRFRLGGEARLELALTGLMPAQMEHDALADIIAWTSAGRGGVRWQP